MSFKRPRSSSPHSDTSKSTCLAQPRSNLLCTLPPTCNHSPTQILNTRDLESHYATYHAHVCQLPSCACVFPDQRLLDLHQTECHDPIAALRQERGEKIFACHLSSCPRFFRTPKTRRQHLIQAHAFPKQFFFAVTNKGVGGLLKRWGEGASMIRADWTPREAHQELDQDSDLSDDDPPPPPAPPSIDALTSSMTSLSLVPPSIRFGRGGKNGGFVHRSGYPAHSTPTDHQHGHTDHTADPDPITIATDGPIATLPAEATTTARGRAGARGRGRARAGARGGRGGRIDPQPALGGAARGGRGGIARAGAHRGRVGAARGGLGE